MSAMPIPVSISEVPVHAVQDHMTTGYLCSAPKALAQDPVGSMPIPHLGTRHPDCRVSVD
jgi:hypothetical protein